MFERILRVFKLDAKLYDELEQDEQSLGQAIAIVSIVAVLTSIGSLITSLTSGQPFLRSWLGMFAWAFFGWGLWTLVSYFIGTSLFGGKGKLSAMFRLIGFAYAPQVLGIIPCVGGLIGWVWSLVAGFIAVRQGLRLDDAKTLVTLVIGAGVAILGYIIFGPVLGIALALLPF